MSEFHRNWFLASRPWSFTMTLISVGVGGAIAAGDGPFHWGLFVATAVGAVCLHAATNLINDYYDVRSGVDREGVSTARYRPHPLLEGKLAPGHIRRAAHALFLIGAGIGTWLAVTRGWEILAIGVIGVVAGFTYTAPPLKYKHIGLGELSVFLMWGPLMVEGAYCVQRQELAADALWISIPFGMLVALVILANNLRDIDDDRELHVRTLAVVLGARRGFRAYLLLMALAYISVLLMIVSGILPVWAWSVLLSLPVAVNLLRTMARRIPDDADARTAQLNTIFGILLLMSLLAETLI
jgi:1,4-dihydroxy-2-naphthoate polyprenyltransferase